MFVILDSQSESWIHEQRAGSTKLKAHSEQLYVVFRFRARAQQDLMHTQLV